MLESCHPLKLSEGSFKLKKNLSMTQYSFFIEVLRLNRYLITLIDT